ncbi:hypothetical protein CJ030_MR6G025923 [Morella rubra]|uniref:Uncharacterized protein n=1 Tax=Morella rubra TaxID=262757 RepID=A0A6A1V870_9ROSI|nr:hypothetical protein CJ030_MR6G025923 [Morella rubra]
MSAVFNSCIKFDFFQVAVQDHHFRIDVVFVYLAWFLNSCSALDPMAWNTLFSHQTRF